jgi:hypothetical protein
MCAGTIPGVCGLLYFGMAEHTKAMVRKAMCWRVAKSLVVSMVVTVALVLSTDLTNVQRGLWGSIAFLLTLYYLRFRDDWYGRP